jgi:hypothetical protein
VWPRTEIGVQALSGVLRLLEEPYREVRVLEKVLPRQKVEAPGALEQEVLEKDKDCF